jgi:SAM-dependent MidA family methyltransferase
MSLKQRLIEQIALEGPISVADYMNLCLFDARDGYYATRPALGADGDFITAPMISQMFGEMIGVWIAEVWQAMGAPEAFRLVEIGGGDGTLMSDIMRVIGRVEGLLAAAEIVMVEPSRPLQGLQQSRIAQARFVTQVADLPDDRPVIIVANEVLDCLPARQFVKTDKGWHERVVGLVDGQLAFGLVPVDADTAPTYPALPGDLVEVSAAQGRMVRELAQLIKRATGAVLLIDYGRDRPEPGDTLQALHRHTRRGPLEAPGEDDLTVWADFELARKMAVVTHVKPSPILTQGAFLAAMGIDARLAALCARHPAQADTLKRQYERLMAPDQMGDLFKVFAMAYPFGIALPGLAGTHNAN